MKNMDHKQAAQMLWEAEQGRYQIDMLTQTHPEMTVEDAYAVQLENVRRREAAGERVVGMKIGLTSVGMQRLLHVHEPDYGHLFENMLLLEREPCLVSGLIQPKVEGELSFCLGKSLQGPGITVADVYDATEWVTPSIEIVDSRIKDWKIRLPDTIADNGSSARFMLGGTDDAYWCGGHAPDRHDSGAERGAGVVGYHGGGVGQPSGLCGMAGQQAGAIRYLPQGGLHRHGRCGDCGGPGQGGRRVYGQLPGDGQRHCALCG